MEQLVNLLVEKVGLDSATAKRVADFLQEHASQVPQWLASEQAKSVLDKLPGGLGGFFGGKKGD